MSALLAAHELRPSRALGQNFLVDPNTARRIARLAGVGPADQVVEIGAGLGSLTLALAATGATVTAVEVDRRLVPVLTEVVEGTGVGVVEGDAMTLDWDGLLGGSAGAQPPASQPVAPRPAAGPRLTACPQPAPAFQPPAGARRTGSWVLVANLPYNLATPLVVRLLEEVPALTRMLVMVQAEVGERLAAGAGDAAYGAVSVKVAYWATASLVGRVPPSVFLPRPRVDSALVAIRRRPAPAVDPAAVGYGRLAEVVRAGFAHRRQMLRRCLAGVVDEAAFVGAGVAPTARAEELDVVAWGRLAAWPATLSDSAS
ncbi:MAG: ribosomal RNA small subunit methyltransferase A [Acidimicrobiales bacterium]